MKKLLFTAISALAVVGVAQAAESTQFGILPIYSTAKRTLVAIPWCESSTTGSNIAVSNLVLTANLTAGDELHVINSNGADLNSWVLTDNGKGVLYWRAPENVVTAEGVEPGVSADAATAKRGSAVALIRKGVIDAAKPIYVMGQVAATGPTATIAQGGAESPSYSMIAPPSTHEQSLNGGDHGATWTGTINPKDRIYVPNPSGPNIELAYATPTAGGDKAWCQIVEKTTTLGGITFVSGVEYVKYDTPIPLGTGIWYVSRGGNPTVTWQDVPMVK